MATDTITYYTVNGSGGAVVTISATCSSRHVTIQEAPDPATYDGTNFNAQGLIYQLPDDNFVKSYAVEPGQPIEIGNFIAEGNAAGPLVGFAAQKMPGGEQVLAKKLIKLRSPSVTATQVKVTEVS